MSYYDHATMIAYRLGPWAPPPEPPLDVPAHRSRPEYAPVTPPCGTETPVRHIFGNRRLGRLWGRIRSRLLPQRPAAPPTPCD